MKPFWYKDDIIGTDRARQTAEKLKRDIRHRAITPEDAAKFIAGAIHYKFITAEQVARGTGIPMPTLLEAVDRLDYDQPPQP